MSSGVPPVVPFALGVGGVALVIAAFRNVSPLQELRYALSGSNPPDKIDKGAGSPALAGTAGTPDATSNLTSPASSGGAGSGAVIESANDPRLVSIGQGGHKLTAAAAASFKQVEGVFGRQITVTDSWRDPSVQRAQHAKDPNRFASAESSAHPRGTAVDVNLQALGAIPENATWKKLYAAFTAAGWCNPRGPYKGDHKEAWHFSYGECR